MSENIEPHVGETEAIPTGQQPGSPFRTSRSPSNGVRVVLIVALVLLIGIGLFAAWQIGRNSASGTGTTTQNGSSAASYSASPEAVAAAVQAKCCANKCHYRARWWTWFWNDH